MALVKILCTGDRNWVRPESSDKEYKDKLEKFYARHDVIYQALFGLPVRFKVTPDDILIIHGAAKGVDSQVGLIADSLGFNVKPYPADWSIGPGGGPIRNRRMLDENRDIKTVLAFHDDIMASRGTLHMSRYAHTKGYEVNVFATDGTVQPFQNLEPQHPPLRRARYS